MNNEQGTMISIRPRETNIYVREGAIYGGCLASRNQREGHHFGGAEECVSKPVSSTERDDKDK